MAKLMACIGLCKRLGPFGDAASSQYFNAVLARKCLRVEPQVAGKVQIQLYEARSRYGRRAHSRIEALRQPRIGVVKAELNANVA
jgi:hypothetical protein